MNKLSIYENPNNLTLFSKLQHFLPPNKKVVLVIILSWAFLLRIFNLNYNSPFVDEAQYVVLGQKVLAGVWEDAYPFSWVGGMPFFFPPMVALFYMFGGIMGARLLNVLLGTASVYLVYEWTKRMQFQKNYVHKIGLIAALFFSFLSVPLFLSRNATYDILSFTLFLAGLVIFQDGLNLKNPRRDQLENRFFISALAFFASFLAKYFSITYFPFLVATGFLSLYRSGRTHKIKFIKFFALPLVIFTLMYIGWQFWALSDFWQTQVDRISGSSLMIISEFAKYTWVVFGLTLIGFIFIRTHLRLSHVFAFLGGLYVLIIHLLTGSQPSLHQQIFLSLAFWMPFAALALHTIVKWDMRYGRLIALGVILTFAIINVPQLTSFETEWPNTRRVMGYLNSVTAPDDLVLSSEDDITVLALPHVDYHQIFGPFYIEYQGISGGEAYRQAVNESYFDTIIFNEERVDDMSTNIVPILSLHYQEVFADPPFKVFRRKQTTATASAELVAP